MLNRMEVDQAVFYAIAARIWQFVAGPVTMLMIAFYFTAEVQGYFYTFASLLALQSFFDLGLSTVIIYVASHEWSGLKLSDTGEIDGDETSIARLTNMVQWISKFYRIASILFIVFVGLAGLYFFSQKPSVGVEWQSPWFLLVLLTGFSLWALSQIAVLEGCNQIATVNRYRVVQAITGNLVVWACIYFGAELWTAVAIAAVKLFWEFYLIYGRFRRFFQSLRSKAKTSSLSWKEEIWPLQWRAAVQGVLMYFSFSLFTPVMFHYHGPESAGQMGMTWTILAALQAIAIAWVQTRTPQFGMLIAKSDYNELDRVFFRVMKVSVSVILIGAVVIGAGVLFLNLPNLIDAETMKNFPEIVSKIMSRLSERMLAPLPTAFFLIAIVLQHIARCRGIYVRAHKKDPFLPVSVAFHISTGLAVWLAGWQYGALGAAAAFLITVGFVFLPYHSVIWRHFLKGRGDESSVIRG